MYYFMSENSKFISGLLLGALAGTALALYLNSEKGKELIANLNIEADLYYPLIESPPKLIESIKTLFDG